MSTLTFNKTIDSDHKKENKKKNLTADKKDTWYQKWERVQYVGYQPGTNIPVLSTSKVVHTYLAREMNSLAFSS